MTAVAPTHPDSPERDALLAQGGGGTTQRAADPTAPVIRRVLIIGASSIEGALGIELERRIERIPGVRCLASLRDLAAWLKENENPI